MKKLLLLIYIITFPTLSYSQDYLIQYFDGADTIPDESLKIVIDTSYVTNIWQIGPPQKLLFDSASTVPNALITDTINPYPINDTSSFQLGFTETFLSLMETGGILALEWNQKLDMDSARDGGMIEYSLDLGQTWVNIFDNPFVYNLYGYSSSNLAPIDSNGTSMAFTGTDSVWRNVWLCFESSWYWQNVQNNGMDIRFTFVSDSVETGQEGWMIDNMLAHLTFVHTVGKKEQEEYLNVYPNPSSGRVHIQAQKKKAFHITRKLEVHNSQGQLVRSFENVPTKFFIDLDDQPNGMYFVKVQTNFETQTFPIILQRE